MPFIKNILDGVIFVGKFVFLFGCVHAFSLIWVRNIFNEVLFSVSHFCMMWCIHYIWGHYGVVIKVLGLERTRTRNS